jgi:hypothetical protein
MPARATSGFELRRIYQNVSRSLKVATGTTPTTVGADFIAARPGYTIYIQKLVVHIITAAAQALAFQDDATSPVKIAQLAASAAVGTHVLIDSEEGVPLTEGENFEIVGVAGVEFEVMVEAYLKPTGTRTVDQV